MLMTLICCLIGIGLSTGLTLGFEMMDSIGDVWKPALIFLGATAGSMGLILIVCFILGFFVDEEKPVEKPSKFYLFLYNLVNSWLVLWSGARVALRESEEIPKGPCLFVCNHRSRFDPMLISHVYRKKKPLMVSKPSNFKIPIAGKAIYAAGFLKVEREDNREGLKMVLKAVEYLKGGEYSIGICPEGTRNKNGRGLLPFRNGAFKIATKAKVPIVVITFEGTEFIAKNFPLKPTKVYMDIVKVIYPKDYDGKTTQEIGAYVKEIMEENMSSYGALPIVDNEATAA